MLWIYLCRDTITFSCSILSVLSVDTYCCRSITFWFLSSICCLNSPSLSRDMDGCKRLLSSRRFCKFPITLFRLVTYSLNSKLSFWIWASLLKITLSTSALASLSYFKVFLSCWSSVVSSCIRDYRLEMNLSALWRRVESSSFFTRRLAISIDVFESFGSLFSWIGLWVDVCFCLLSWSKRLLRD